MILVYQNSHRIAYTSHIDLQIHQKSKMNFIFNLKFEIYGVMHFKFKFKNEVQDFLNFKFKFKNEVRFLYDFIFKFKFEIHEVWNFIFEFKNEIHFWILTDLLLWWWILWIITRFLCLLNRMLHHCGECQPWWRLLEKPCTYSHMLPFPPTILCLHDICVCLCWFYSVVFWWVTLILLRMHVESCTTALLNGQCVGGLRASAQNSYTYLYQHQFCWFYKKKVFSCCVCCLYTCSCYV